VDKAIADQRAETLKKIDSLLDGLGQPPASKPRPIEMPKLSWVDPGPLNGTATPDPSKGKTDSDNLYFVTYTRKGDKPDGGELYGVYKSQADANKAVASIKKWAADIARTNAEYGVKNGAWEIDKINVEKMGGGKSNAAPRDSGDSRRADTTPATARPATPGERTSSQPSTFPSLGDRVRQIETNVAGLVKKGVLSGKGAIADFRQNGLRQLGQEYFRYERKAAPILKAKKTVDRLLNLMGGGKDPTTDQEGFLKRARRFVDVVLRGRWERASPDFPIGLVAAIRAEYRVGLKNLEKLVEKEVDQDLKPALDSVLKALRSFGNPSIFQPLRDSMSEPPANR
jgi:hypothetical protein